MIIYICELRAQMISFTDIAGTGTITVTLQCSFRSTCSNTSVTKYDRYGHALTVSIIAIFSQSVLYDIISILLENNCSDRSLELKLLGIYDRQANQPTDGQTGSLGRFPSNNQYFSTARNEL